LRHPEYTDLTIAEMLEHEQPSLMPMVTPFDGYVETLGKVSSTCLVSWIATATRCRANWPARSSACGLPGADRLRRHDSVVASHPRSCFERKQTRYDWQHYIPLIERKPGALRNGAPFADMPEPLQRLRALLLQREGGDRVMAKVLAAVPKARAGGGAGGRRTGSGIRQPSAEHVENVLNRLKAAAMPQPSKRTLTVSEAPLADTGRYDRLRTEVSHA
jgi:hypothetical protein